ncbi:RNA-splicing factor [Kappamyces sp. JEL0680]|nr:RNA-splicing factor [Kappamyces sp. JEL0680]
MQFSKLALLALTTLSLAVPVLHEQVKRDALDASIPNLAARSLQMLERREYPAGSEHLVKRDPKKKAKGKKKGKKAKGKKAKKAKGKKKAKKAKAAAAADPAAAAAADPAAADAVASQIQQAANAAADLNLKKSWHPNRFANQAKVWEREQAVEAEKRKIEQMRKELQEERDREELARLHNQGRNRWGSGADGRTNKERLEWMYSAGPGQSQDFIDQEKEDYLLGRKKIDVKTILGEEGFEVSGCVLTQSALGPAVATTSIYGVYANTTRDMQAKVRDDPLLAFRKQEQAALEAMMKNPLKVGRIKEKDSKKSKKSKRDRSRSADRKRDRSRDRPERRGDIDSRDDRRERRDDRDSRYDRDRDDRRERSRKSDRYDDRRSRSRERVYRKESRSPVRDDQADQQKRLEEMQRNAQTWNKDRASRVTQERQQEEKESRLEEQSRLGRTEASSFGAELQRSVFKNGNAADMIQRNKGISQHY